MTTKRSAIALELLQEADLEAVLPWFDDRETQRWIGGRDWPRQALRLATASNRRHALLVSHGGRAVGLIDAEIEPSGQVGFAIVIAPGERRKGMAEASIAAMAKWAVLRKATSMFGGVERGNLASERLMMRAGLRPVGDHDAEGFRYFELLLSQHDVKEV